MWLLLLRCSRSKAQIPLRRLPQNFPIRESFGEVGVMEFGLKGTSRVCRGLVSWTSRGSRHRPSGIWALRRSGSKVAYLWMTGEETQINIMGNINEPYMASNRFEVAFSSTPPRFRLELTIVGASCLLTYLYSSWSRRSGGLTDTSSSVVRVALYGNGRAPPTCL